jgi:4-diphosphocytidyl-2-C-methyl-D-erythritol kinase
VTGYEAPAKLNLALVVRPPESGGFHPIESLVQTIDWIDLLEVEEADEDRLAIEGLDIETDDNLVKRALGEIRLRGEVPPLDIRLHKRIPTEAGLGGGSSDAAATLLAASEAGRLPSGVREEVAPVVGADVALFLVGGSLEVSGIGEVIVPRPALAGFAVAVAVPEFGLRTADVYRRWDELEGPMGEAVPDSHLPPPLRDGIPIRNDLTPSAVDLEPALADYMADLRSLWGRPVMMTGSGSACHAFFADLDEAVDAARAAPSSSQAARGVELRPRGVARAEE